MTLLWSIAGVDKFPAITDGLCHTLVEEECVPDWRQVRSGIARTAQAIREVVDALQNSTDALLGLGKWE
jgi:hypothetical protein